MAEAEKMKKGGAKVTKKKGKKGKNPFAGM